MQDASKLGSVLQLLMLQQQNLQKCSKTSCEHTLPCTLSVTHQCTQTHTCSHAHLVTHHCTHNKHHAVIHKTYICVNGGPSEIGSRMCNNA